MRYAFRFHVKMALQNLVVHKARMILAVLGILFAVMSLVAFGNISGGMKKKIDDEISRFGKNLVILRAGLVFATGRGTRTFQDSKTLKLNDARRIREELTGVEEAVPFFDMVYPARYRENKLNVSIVGTTEHMFLVKNVDLLAGRLFTEEDSRGLEKKAVVGYKVFDSLFQREDPIGKYLLIFRAPTEVIGVMTEKGADFTGQDQDLQVYLPLTTFMRRYSNVDHIKGVYVQVREGIPLTEMKVRLRAFMRKLHNLRGADKDDFSVFTMEDILKTKEEGIRLVSILTVIASTVSFLIGGLGIFAIMLLSVSERKLEIGIRRVVGSKKKDIVFQFLAESVIVALIGGFFGLCAGFIITVVVGLAGGLPLVVGGKNIVLSLLVSVIVGMLAGLYPALEGTKYETVNVLYQ